MWPADPSRIGKTAGTAVDTIRSISAQLTPSSDVEHSGSPLWVERSRGRHLEWVRLDVDDLKRTGKTLGATMNDVFLAGLAEATHRYHARHGSTIETTNSSFVLSTRTDGKVGGNAFTPVPVRLPAGNMKPQERLATVSAMLAEAKEEAQRTGGMIGVSGIANLLPISVVTRAARSAASRIDFATSNLRGAPCRAQRSSQPSPWGRLLALAPTSLRCRTTVLSTSVSSATRLRLPILPGSETTSSNRSLTWSPLLDATDQWTR